VANKNVSSSPRPRAKPRRASPPRSRAEGQHDQYMRGLNRRDEQEQETAPRGMKSGGSVCRGMGAASRGGKYKK
jgi:hypothetical protein